MSQYAHYSVGTPELNAAVAKLPSVLQFENINSLRESFAQALSKSQALREALLPPVDISYLNLKASCHY